MAKEKKTKEQLEIERREKEEELLRDKELKKELKEKEEKAKAREKRRQKRLKDEEKRIKGIVDLPFKLLWHISLLITIFAFIVIFFVAEITIYKTLLWTFFIFTFFYLGGGGVMVGYFLILSVERKKELEEQIRLEEEEKEREEKLKQEQELAELEAIERDLAIKRGTSRAMNELQANNSSNDMVLDEVASKNLDELNIMGVDDISLDELPDTDDILPDSNDEDSYLNELLASEFDKQ